jgi:hypothetical protein
VRSPRSGVQCPVWAIGVEPTCIGICEHLKLFSTLRSASEEGHFNQHESWYSSPSQDRVLPCVCEASATFATASRVDM